MARPKKKSEPKEAFDLDKALANVNPFLVEGFKWFIMGKKITNQKAFDKELELYGGFK